MAGALCSIRFPADRGRVVGVIDACTSLITVLDAAEASKGSVIPVVALPPGRGGFVGVCGGCMGDAEAGKT